MEENTRGASLLLAGRRRSRVVILFSYPRFNFILLFFFIYCATITEAIQCTFTSGSSYWDFSKDVGEYYINDGNSWWITLCNSTTQCAIANSDVCKAGQSWGTTTGSTLYFDNRVGALARQNGPGTPTCNGTFPYSSTTFIVCNLTYTTPIVDTLSFFGCVINATVYAASGCPWCNGASGYPQSLGGDCSCSSSLPAVFSPASAQCASSFWTYPSPSLPQLSTFSLDVHANLLKAALLLRTSQFAITSGGVLELTVLINTLNNNNTASGGSVAVSGCLTLGGDLVVNFDPASLYSTAGTSVTYSLITYACRNGSSVFNNVYFNNTAFLGSSSARVVQGLTSVDLVIQQGITIPPPTGSGSSTTTTSSASTTSSTTSNPPGTSSTPITAHFNNTPSVQLQGGGLTAYAFFRSLVECRVTSVGNSTNITTLSSTQMNFATDAAGYIITQTEETILSITVRNLAFSTTLTNNAQVLIDFLTAQTASGFSVDFGGMTIPVGIYDVKFTLGINNWPWTHNDTKLCVLTDLDTSTFTSFASFNVLPGPISGSTSYQFVPTTTSTTSLEVVLVNVSVVDGSSVVPVDYGINPGGSQLWIALPHFAASIEYDPNLGILVQGDGGGGGGDGGGGSLAWIAAVVIVPLVLCSAVFAVMVILLFLLYRKQRFQKMTQMQRPGSIHFGPSELLPVEEDPADQVNF